MVLILLVSLNISPLVNNANKLYKSEKYEEAYDLYKKASILYPDNEKIKFNLADCTYKLKRFREAADGFSRLTGISDPELKQRSFYNLGNTFMEVKEFSRAIDAYKRALIIDAGDERAKRNLEIAKMLLKEQKKNQKKNEEEKDKDKEQQKQEQKQQQQPQESKIQQALENEQKKTMKKRMKAREGREKEAGKW